MTMNRIYTLCICLLLLLTGCSKFLDDYSQDLVTPKTVQDLDEVLLGNGYLPRIEVPVLHKGTLAWWLHLLDDDINTVVEQIAIYGMSEMEPYYYGYTTWQLEVGRSYNKKDLRGDSREWEELYGRINTANIILDEVDNMPQPTDKERLHAIRVKGESYFLRAQFYFMLVNLYAPAYRPGQAGQTTGIPLKLTAYVEHDNQKESQFVRNSVEEVYQQIVTDLLESVSALTISPQPRPGHRASANAARLLLSRVYLYMQDWTNAAKYAQEVMDDSPTLMHYGTMGEKDVVLQADNPEIIFSQGALNLQNVMTGRSGDFCVSEDLYNLYSTDDYRRELYFTRAFVSDSVALSRKYKRGLQIASVSDLFLLRTAEAHLNLIEAQAMLGMTTEAQQNLNRFRGFRMSMQPPTALDLPTLVQQIRAERRKELCFEGHRWFDLRRYAVDSQYPYKKEINRSYTVYDWDDKNKVKQTEVFRLKIDDPAYTMPIPKVVFDIDQGLTNNPREPREPVEIIDLKK